MLDLRTQAEAAEALRLSERTLERMRLPGLGPVFAREKRYEESRRADRRLNGFALSPMTCRRNHRPNRPSRLAEANRPAQGFGI
jgi:hypothetical protein